jgi:hypothetical protein
MTLRATVNSTDAGPVRPDLESGEIAKHWIDGEWIESDTVAQSIKQPTGGVLYRLDASIRVEGSHSRAIADLVEQEWRSAHRSGTNPCYGLGDRRVRQPDSGRVPQR